MMKLSKKHGVLYCTCYFILVAILEAWMWAWNIAVQISLLFVPLAWAGFEECKMQNCHDFQSCSRMVWVGVWCLQSSAHVGRDEEIASRDHHNSSSWVCAPWFVSNTWERISDLPSWFRVEVHYLRQGTRAVWGLVWAQRNHTQLKYPGLLLSLICDSLPSPWSSYMSHKYKSCI